MKYGNIKTTIDNIKFDSKAEANRYLELKLLLKGKVIKDLRMQPRFVLLESFIDGQGEKHRKIEYVADFEYKEGSKHIIEDVKGMKTEVYKLKKKLFLYTYRSSIFREIN